jgi:hypothetical protein
MIEVVSNPEASPVIDSGELEEELTVNAEEEVDIAALR